MLVPCQGCGREIDTTAKACPGCGRPDPAVASAPAVQPPAKPKGFFAKLMDGAREAERFGTYGAVNSALVCPHCQVKGKVRTKEVKRKKGISGGKVAAAVLLSPVTLLATGLSRKEQATQAHCDNCDSSWDY
jgi:hypothetical protein